MYIRRKEKKGDFKFNSQKQHEIRFAIQQIAFLEKELMEVLMDDEYKNFISCMRKNIDLLEEYYKLSNHG